MAAALDAKNAKFPRPQATCDRASPIRLSSGERPVIPEVETWFLMPTDVKLFVSAGLSRLCSNVFERLVSAFCPHVSLRLLYLMAWFMRVDCVPNALCSAAPSVYALSICERCLRLVPTLLFNLVASSDVLPRRAFRLCWLIVSLHLHVLTTEMDVTSLSVLMFEART